MDAENVEINSGSKTSRAPPSQACDKCRAKKKRCVWKVGQDSCSLCRRTGKVCTTDYVRAQRPTGPRRKYLPALKKRESPSEGRSVGQVVNGPLLLDATISAAESSSRVQGDADEDQRTTLWPLSFAGLNSNATEGLDVAANAIDIANLPVEVDAGENVDHGGPRTEIDIVPGLIGSPAANCSPQFIQTIVEEYLDHFNKALPLFRVNWVHETFSQLCDTNKSVPGSSLLCFHTLLAIAHRFRAHRPGADEDDDIRASLYVQYVCSQLGNLLVQEPSLSQAQCLVGIAIVIEGTSTPQRACAVLSAALRVIQQLQTKNVFMGNSNDPAESEQLQMIFWIAFCIETSWLLRLNQQSALTMDIDDVALPSEDPDDAFGPLRKIEKRDTPFGSIMRPHVQLAILQHRVLKIVLPSHQVKHRNKVTGDDFRYLCDQFQDWRSSFLPNVSPAEVRDTFTPSDIVHILVLEGKAFETLCAIHGITNQSFNDMDGSQLLGDNFISMDSLLVAEAERFLQLRTMAPGGDVACNHLNVEATFLASFITLLAIVQSPWSASVESALELSESAIEQVRMLRPLNQRAIGACLALQTFAEKLINRHKTVMEATQALKQVRVFFG